MPAPTYTLALTGTAPNQTASKQQHEDALNAALEAVWSHADGKADRANSGKSFATRAAAVSSGQENLRATLGQITTREGNYLVLRSATATADDPLFSTSPQWGVVQRLPSSAEVGRGRMFLSNSLTPSGIAVPDGAAVVDTRVTGGTQRWMPATAPVGGVETPTLKKDAADNWWALSSDSRAAQFAPIPLVGVSGGAAIVASVPAPFAWVPVASGVTVDLQIPATAAAPTLTVDGIGPYPIVDADGQPLPTGWWAVGRRVSLKLFGTVWRVTSGLGVAVRELVSLSGQAAAAQGTLYDLARALNDPHQSVRMRFIGDSITWGNNASGTGASDPRTGQLTDPRASLDAPSYVNLVRKWLAGAYFSPTIAEQGPGWARYRSKSWMAVALDAADWVPHNVASGEVSPRVTGAGGSMGTYLDVVLGTEARSTFTGDGLIVRFARVSQAGAVGRVYIDGAQVGPDIDLNGAPAFGHEVAVTVPYGTHTVALRCAAGPSNARWRIEAVTINRLFQVANDGILGRNVSHWLPGNGLLTGGLVQGYEWAFINLGTNSRIIQSGTVNDPLKVRSGLVTIVEALQADGKSVVLLAPNLATGSMDIDDNPATYAFGQRDVRRAVQEAAQSLGVPSIDLFAPTYLATQEGQTVLSDGLHPNDLGHRIMASEMRRAISDAERVVG